MNLVALLILPAIIELRDNNVRFVIAGAALLVVLAAVIISKRQGSSNIDPASAAIDDAQAAATMAGDRNATLRQAIDLWIADLDGGEEDLVDQLRAVRASLPES